MLCTIAPLALAAAWSPTAHAPSGSLRAGCPPAMLAPPAHARLAGSLRARRPPAMLTPAELIDLGVRVDTFAPQFLWLLIIALPRAAITERVMGPIGPLLGLSFVHLAVVLLAATSPGGTEPIAIFADVFDPAQSQLDGMVRLFQVRDFVAEEWPHVLVWDLFVGRAIWLDSLDRGTPYTWASLLLTNGIGPPGLLLYVLLCLGSGRGLPTLGYSPRQ